jgi:hypothetical protein
MTDSEGGALSDESVVPDGVPVLRAGELDEVYRRGALRAVIELVGALRGQSGVEGVIWVDAVLLKLNDIGVKSVRDFISSVLTVNSRLERNGHRQMHTITLTSMLSQACELIFEDESEDGEIVEVSS